MRTIGLLTLGAVLGLVTATPAQDAPAPFVPATGAVARPFPASAKPVERKPAVVVRDNTRQQILTTDQAAIVLQAASHLAAAGYAEDAAMLRERVKQVRTEQQNLLAEKTEQLRKLEAEVRELRRLSGQLSQFQVTVQFVEVSRSRLHELGFNGGFQGIYEAQLAELKGPTQLVSAQINSVVEQSATIPAVFNRQAVAASLELLRRDGAAKILSNSSLITADGRPAVAALSGGEYPIVIPDQEGGRKIEYRDFGTRLEAAVFSEPGNRVRLEVQPELSVLDFQNQLTVDGTAIPAINSTRLNTIVTMDIGQTAVLGGMIRRSRTTAPDGTTTQDEAELLILATVEQASETANHGAELP